MLNRIVLVMFMAAMTGMTAMAEPVDKKMGLHSDGGPWRFYPAAKIDSKLPNVLLIGDSIMNGYRAHVIAGLKSKANVDCWLTPAHLKSKGLHEDLGKVASFRKYNVIHFNIGLHGWTPGRIGKGQYEPAMREYVKILRVKCGNARLIWCSTTQITVKGKPTELDSVHNKTIVNRNAVALKVMKEHNVAVNDLYGLMSDKLKMARGDGFHWNGAAYGLMAKQVVRHIEMALNAAEGKEHISMGNLVWTSPSTDSKGSMPIGNGEIGANVWVEKNGDLLFYLSRTDAWSENCRLLKLGRVRVALTPNSLQEGCAFSQTLDVQRGEIVIRFKNGLSGTLAHEAQGVERDGDSLGLWHERQRGKASFCRTGYDYDLAEGSCGLVSPQ